jgi:5-methylcytosine-specific restriction endonuclease McrA
MKCHLCGELLKFTGCNSPTCTGYACDDCGIGCDFERRPEVLSRCANRIAETRTAAWEPVAVGNLAGPIALLAAGSAASTRSPVTRTGERAPIDSTVRRGVFMRDRGRCQLCGRFSRNAELDHVVPWSAGGSDRSDNLRVTCQTCNQDRSNFMHVADAAKPLPVSALCQVCAYQPDRGVPVVQAFCTNCRRASSSYEDGLL